MALPIDGPVSERLAKKRTAIDSPTMTPPFDPAAFAQRQLDAYNARDLQRFVAEYTDDVTAWRLGSAEPLVAAAADTMRLACSFAN